MLRIWPLLAAALVLGCGDERKSTPAASLPQVSRADDKAFQDRVLDRSDDEVVLVMFMAPWSGPDRILEPFVRDATAERDMALVLVNVDKAGDTATRYDVLAIPTLQAFVDGEPAGERSVGALPRPRLNEFLDEVEDAAS